MRLYGIDQQIYQGVHRQEVIVATPLRLPHHPGLSFRNAVASDPTSLLESRAGFLVIHHQLIAEESGFTGSRCSLPGRGFPAEVRAVLASMTPRVIDRVRRAWGDPVFEDGVIQVWDLRVIRAARGAR